MMLGFQQTPRNHSLFLLSSGAYSACLSSLSGHFSLQMGPGTGRQSSRHGAKAGGGTVLAPAALGGGGCGDPVPVPWGHVPAHGGQDWLCHQLPAMPGAAFTPNP